MSQEAGKWMARVVPAVVLALLACSVTHAQDVKYNYRQGTDFSKYHTYNDAAVLRIERKGQFQYLAFEME
jgi:hypothetical protein